MMFNKKGFTLIELMVVVAIIGTLAAIATPNFIRFMNESKARSDIRDLISGLQGAKMSAVKENGRAVIVFDVNAESYSAFIDNESDCGGNPWWYDNGCDDLIKTQTMSPGTNLYTNFNGNTFGFTSRGIPEGLTLLAGQAIDNQFTSVFIQSSTDRYFRVRISAAGAMVLEESSDGTTNWN